MKNQLKLFLIVLGVVLNTLAISQVTLPPSGDNQKSEITQYLGLVRVSIKYSSPDVNGRKVWGELVPYPVEQPSDPKIRPWRAGANENTTITFSHDVEIEGKALKAGTYGIHMIPGTEQWTIIFSNISSAWGSFSYKPADDALRVTVKPEPCEFNEYLTYEFVDRKQNSSTARLMWDKLAVPFKIAVSDGDQLYIQNLRNELLGEKRFYWQNVVSAASFCASKKRNLDEALVWVESLINSNLRNFQIYTTKINILAAMGKTDEANLLMDEAINLPDASAQQLTIYGRSLITEGKTKEAFKVFETSYKRYPETSAARMGLARGYSALGDQKKALKFAQSALKVETNERIRISIEGSIKKLEQGEGIN